MTIARPQTRWKRLVVVSLALLIVGAYGIIAWGSGTAAWPIHAVHDHLRRAVWQKQWDAELMRSVPFDTPNGGGYIGLPGTTIWAIVPQGVFGSRHTPASNGIRGGLRPLIMWRESGQCRIVIVTTLEAIEAGPPDPLPPESPYREWWAGLHQTAGSIVSDAESGDDPALAYSIPFDAPEGARRRLDVDLEFGAAVILEWVDGDPEPPDMWEYFTIGEPVPADGQ